MADTNGGQDVQGTLPRRQRVGRVVLLAGAVLLVVAFFVPWVTLHYATFIGDVPVPGVATYSPLGAVWRSVAYGGRLFAGAVLGAFVVLLYSTMRLIARPARPASRRLARVPAGLSAGLSAELAVLCLCVVLFLFAVAVPGTALLGAFVALLYCTMRLIARPASQASRRLAAVSAGLAGLCLGVTLLLLAFVIPGNGLSMTERFVDATVEYGALVGVVAFAVVAVGSALLAA